MKRLGDYCDPQINFFEFDDPISDFWPLEKIVPLEKFAFAKWVRALIWTNPRFLPFLLGQAASYIHVMHYVFDGLRHRSDEMAHKVGATAEDLMRTPQELLLRRFARPYTPELGVILEKLEGFSWQFAEYRQLALLVLDKSSWAVISCTNTINQRFAELLYALPKGLRWSPVFLNARFIEDIEFHQGDINFAARSLRVPSAELIRILASTHTAGQFNSWLNERVETSPFPKPPWPGTATLRPITTPAAFRAPDCEWSKFENYSIHIFHLGFIYPYALEHQAGPDYSPYSRLAVAAVENAAGSWHFCFMEDWEHGPEFQATLAEALRNTQHTCD